MSVPTRSPRHSSACCAEEAEQRAATPCASWTSACSRNASSTCTDPSCGHRRRASSRHPMPSPDRPLVTAVIPCRNEARYIGPCLESLIGCDYPKDRLEVLVCDGLSDDGTREIVTGYAARHSFIRLVDNPRRNTPCAMNRSEERRVGKECRSRW